MENNIDKILRNALENHEEIPPGESWMHIHTEIAKQNRRILTPVLVGLFLGILLISGIGISIYYGSKSNENLVVSNIKTKPLFIPKNVQNSNLEGVLLAENNQIVAAVTGSKILFGEMRRKVFLQRTRLSVLQTLPLSVSPQTIELSSVETQTTAENSAHNSEEKPSENDSVQYFSEIKENINLKNNEIQPVELLAKSYVSTDLSEKMNEALVGKIDGSYLKENNVSIDSLPVRRFGKRFSLKHPMIEINLLSGQQSLWTTSGEIQEDVLLANNITKGGLFRIGVSWRAKPRLRVGIAFSVHNNSQISLGRNLNSYKQNPNLKLENFNGKYRYFTQTFLGGMYFPIDYLSVRDKTTGMNNNNFTSSTYELSVDQYSQSILAFQYGLNAEYDLISKIRKNKHKYGYQLYALGELALQDIKLNSNLSAYGSFDNDNRFSIFSFRNRFENSNKYSLATRLGLGFRWQIGGKLDIYTEASGQRSLTSFVHDLPFNTYQNTFSWQAGFHLNL